MVSESIIVDYEKTSYKQKTQEFCKRLPRQSVRYVSSFFPIIHWIHRYNTMVRIRFKGNLCVGVLKIIC